MHFGAKIQNGYKILSIDTYYKGKLAYPHFRHFPQTAVYPAIGNHEMFPVNMFPDEDQPVPQIYDPSWLYNNLADLYQHWLPDTAQQNTLRDSGYYSVSTLL